MTLTPHSPAGQWLDNPCGGGAPITSVSCTTARDPAPKKRGRQKHGGLVNQAIRLLYAYGCFVWENKTGGWKTAEGRAIRYGKTGSTDIIGLTPEGRFIGAEVKIGYDKLKPEQELFRDRVLEKNGIHIEVRSLADIEAREAEIRGAIR